MAVLGPAGVAQQGGQRVEHRVHVELWVAGRGHDRNVVTPLGAVGEGDADQLGLHGVGVRRLRVDRQRGRALQPGHQLAQGRFVRDDLVIGPGRRLGCGLPPGVGAFAEQAELVGHARRLDLRLLLHPRQPLDQRAKLQLAEEVQHLPPVEGAHAAGVEIELHRRVAHDRRQAAAEEGQVAPRLQFVPEAGLDLVQVLVDTLQRIVLLEQLHGGLLAHAPHARDVVRFIAHQRLEVHQLGRRQPVPLLHPVQVVDHRVREAPAGGEDAGVLVHQLQQVHVAGDDERLHALRLRLAGQRPQ